MAIIEKPGALKVDEKHRYIIIDREKPDRGILKYEKTIMLSITIPQAKAIMDYLEKKIKELEIEDSDANWAFGLFLNTCC